MSDLDDMLDNVFGPLEGILDGVEKVLPKKSEDGDEPIANKFPGGWLLVHERVNDKPHIVIHAFDDDAILIAECGKSFPDTTMTQEPSMRGIGNICMKCLFFRANK